MDELAIDITLPPFIVLPCILSIALSPFWKGRKEAAESMMLKFQVEEEKKKLGLMTKMKLGEE
jgi:hypothetical protein